MFAMILTTVPLALGQPIPAAAQPALYARVPEPLPRAAQAPSTVRTLQVPERVRRLMAMTVPGSQAAPKATAPTPPAPTASTVRALQVPERVRRAMAAAAPVALPAQPQPLEPARFQPMVQPMVMPSPPPPAAEQTGYSAAPTLQMLIPAIPVEATATPAVAPFDTPPLPEECIALTDVAQELAWRRDTAAALRAVLR